MSLKLLLGITIWLTYLGTCMSQRECKQSTLGGGYTGTVEQTLSGIPCQRWDLQYPHTHPFTESAMFPDDSIMEAANFCRNPGMNDGSWGNYILQKEGPWCYTLDEQPTWEYCNVSHCGVYPEGKLTDEGTEYRGRVQQSVSGLPCLDWESVPQETLDSLNVISGKELVTDDANYCRNPDSKLGGPWCYVNDPSVWEYCDVSFIRPSASCKNTDLGDNYVGTVSVTRTHRKCQRWDKQFPHSHIFTDPALFPDDTLSDAENFCRNPSGDMGGLWCYTLDPQIPWQYCDIPLCKDCKVTNSSREYGGTLSVTGTGKTCQRWDYQLPHPHNMTDPRRYPDASLAEAANYCRNPDSKTEGPWCFTRDIDSEWEFCDIPLCTGRCQNQPKPKRAKHTVHFGIDGLNTCFRDSPSSAPNILQRIANEGSYSFNGRTVYLTMSGPSWGATQCGAGLETTGVDGNGWQAAWKGWTSAEITPTTGTDIPFPCVCATLKYHDQTIHTAAFHDWDWYSQFMDYGNPGSIDFEDVYDAYQVGLPLEEQEGYLAGNASLYLKQVLMAAESSYTYVYMYTLDHQGHKPSVGWCTTEWFNWVEYVDGLVGQVLDAIDDAGMTDEVMVVLAGDHGSTTYSHGASIDAHIKIPMFMKGPGIKKGFELQHPTRIEDSVNNIVYGMGLDRNPWWTGNVWLEAFEDKL